jgi:hypothetical protein
MALVEMSVVEQRYRAVLAVGRGEPKIVVAAQLRCRTVGRGAGALHRVVSDLVQLAKSDKTAGVVGAVGGHGCSERPIQ